jgi:hypothetical protein
VQLKLTTNLASDPQKADNFEDISDLYFNLKPDYFVGHLIVLSSVPSGVTLAQQALNNVYAGDEHTFDLHFDSGSGSGSLLTGSNVVTLTLGLNIAPTGTDALTSQSFKSITTGNLPNYFAAVHVQGTGSNWQGSTWAGSNAPTTGGFVVTPVPRAAIGGIVLLGGLTLRRRISAAMKPG